MAFSAKINQAFGERHEKCKQMMLTRSDADKKLILAPHMQRMRPQPGSLDTFLRPSCSAILTEFEGARCQNRATCHLKSPRILAIERDCRGPFQCSNRIVESRQLSETIQRKLTIDPSIGQQTRQLINDPRRRYGWISFDFLTKRGQLSRNQSLHQNQRECLRRSTKSHPPNRQCR